MAVYQNHKTNAGIAVTVVTAENSVISQAITDAKGNYTVLVPAKAAFWLVYAAPLHLTKKVLIQPKTKVTKVILRGGDLDQDGCIGTTDLSLMTSAFEGTTTTADITGDGVVDARDLAILAGNYDPKCSPTQTATSTATELTTPTPTVSSADTLTTEPSATPEAIATDSQ